MRILRLAPLVLVTACTLSVPRPDAAPVDRLQAECTLLQSAAAMMAEQGSTPPDGLLQGCPGVTATDTRPLAQQTASLRAANAAPLPETLPAGSRAETVFRRMITRGVPPALATSLVTSAEFTAATQ
jgi:hypothetical protein